MRWSSFIYATLLILTHFFLKSNIPIFELCYNASILTPKGYYLIPIIWYICESWTCFTKDVNESLFCNGHIINLAVCAFFFEKHLDAKTQAEHSEKHWIETSIQEENAWKRISSLGKLHNIIVYIMESTQRIKLLNRLSGSLMSKKDNKTCWNSWYEMLNWSLTKTKVGFLENYLLRI